jgi:predicted molibdopterin-dependent oxidoreductase YjgC
VNDRSVPVAEPRRLVTVSVDGQDVRVPEGATLLDACRRTGVDIPTLCYGETLEPRNACRVCTVELDGSRTLVPSCSRGAEDGMVVRTDTERTRHARRLVLELLGSSVDLSHAPGVASWMAEVGADPERFGPPAAPHEHEAVPPPGEHHAPDGSVAATVQRPALEDNDLYVRDYARCILCYKCVDACGEQWQNTFAIAVAGRGFDARIATEWSAPLTDSACVYCGNCIAVCPTGALVGRTEYDMRRRGEWDESRQTATDTICPFCGVGCTLTLHVQDDRIVKASSPLDHQVGHGNLCIKGRFGWQHVQP